MFLVQPSAREGPERHTRGSRVWWTQLPRPLYNGNITFSPMTSTENMMTWCGRAFTRHQETQTLLVHVSVQGTKVCSAFAGTGHSPRKKQTPAGTQDRGRNKGLPWPEEGPGTSFNPLWLSLRPLSLHILCLASPVSPAFKHQGRGPDALLGRCRAWPPALCAVSESLDLCFCF